MQHLDFLRVGKDKNYYIAFDRLLKVFDFYRVIVEGREINYHA